MSDFLFVLQAEKLHKKTQKVDKATVVKQC